MENDVYLKPCIFIASVGRTGTHFFGYKMSEMIRDCFSVHEPDVLRPGEIGNLPGMIKEFGLYRMTVGKFLPRYSLRVLNLSRRRGSVSDSQAVEYLKEMRRDMVSRAGSGIYLEANWQYRGLIDLIPAAFPNSRIIYVIRDPRTWVRSQVNKMTLYSWTDTWSWFRNGRLTPFHIKGDPYAKRWKSMSRFERLCWAWTSENSYALECVRKTGAARVFRYEDLFSEETRRAEFSRMFEFATSFPGLFDAEWELKEELLDQKVDSRSGGEFLAWTSWSNEQIAQLERHCRPLMDRFGYGKEADWRLRVDESGGR